MLGVREPASLSIVSASDLPSPPSFESLAAWAGPGRVIRAEPADVANWRLPAGQKVALTSSGVPLLDGVVDMPLFAADPRDGRYCLAGTGDDPRRPDSVYLADPETGLVSALEPSTGHRSFVNSSVSHWLCSLHLVGTRLSNSAAIQAWDTGEAMEYAALAELADLLQRITHLDPAAYGQNGDHATRYWPAVLDRWLY